ncbi:hypothetical protein [Rubrivivax gelatinosus]|uniref:Uncharacterized protein n=1 Tax=Rubrivivax gelatinosus TaxID=28068 RepID=A0ABS1DS62_RUBGE|nr:hypothetical protein [Rubrivivax gelatinosus]MBK1712328.1 hypothetical protein [Rubrivivax gelatinosus]
MFIDYDRTLGQIEAELQRVGLALGIDWADDARMRALAREVFEHWLAGGNAVPARTDRRGMSRCTLFGLIGLLAVTLTSAPAPAAADEPGAARLALARAFASLQAGG